jgi:deoxyribodipyrimidine photo-lyase
LKGMGSDIKVFFDSPLNAFKELNENYKLQKIYTNHDYEKYGITRDAAISDWAESQGVNFLSFKDQVIFEKREVLSGLASPYTVFSPYARKWKETLSEKPFEIFDTKPYFSNFAKNVNFEMPSLPEMGFLETDIECNVPAVNTEIISKYGQQRDFPAIKGTTRLSIHLRFGTLSIRKAVQMAQGVSEHWLNELIWRDFYFNILANFPHINEGKAFKPAYDNIAWRKNEDDFQKWQEGKTGFAIVDAGMRELNNTGFMHNRVRMIVASFLCKDLLLDWRWGEAYFASQLNDFDFSANNGGWQWASGSGCDAAPYFRVFNPESQTLKFDKQLQYIRKWVPEFNDFNYKPMLDHKMARDRALKVYKEGLGGLGE